VDTESSIDTHFIVGTLDLKTNDEDGVSQILSASSLACGETVGPCTIVLKNSGSVGGQSLDVAFYYEDSDVFPNEDPMTADATAAMIEVTMLEYGGTSLLSSEIDLYGNCNGWTDVNDLMLFDFSGQVGIDALMTNDFIIEVRLRSDTAPVCQDDGIDLTITFVLNQQ